MPCSTIEPCSITRIVSASRMVDSRNYCAIPSVDDCLWRRRRQVDLDVPLRVPDGDPVPWVRHGVVRLEPWRRRHDEFEADAGIRDGKVVEGANHTPCSDLCRVGGHLPLPVKPVGSPMGSKKKRIMPVRRSW